MKKIGRKSIFGLAGIMLVLSLQMCILVGCDDEDDEKEAVAEQTQEVEQESTADEVVTNESEEVAEVPEVEEEPQGPTARDMWEGTWFGCLNFGDCTGKFEASSGVAYANYLVLNFEDDNKGKFNIYNSWKEYGNGEFEIVDGTLQVTGGTAFDAPINTDNWKFENIDSFGRKIIMEDVLTDVDGDNLQFFIWLKPWGADWSEMNQTSLYEDIFKPYEEKLAAGQNPPYGFVNDYMNSDEAIKAAVTPSSDTGKDTDAKNGSDKNADADNGGGSEGLDIPAVDPDNFVIVDNESVKIVCKGTGVDKYNDSWIGYTLVITNKTKDSLFFNARSAVLEDNNIGGGDTCFYNGKQNKTHFEMVMNPEISDYEMTLAIDGVTDISQVKDVSGYIYVSNDTTHEEIGYFPYHFK